MPRNIGIRSPKSNYNTTKTTTAVALLDFLLSLPFDAFYSGRKKKNTVDQ